MAIHRPWSKLALTGLGLALISIQMAALSGIGSRMGMWHFSVGFSALKWAAILAMVGLAVSLVAFYVTRIRKTRRGTVLAVLGAIIALSSVTPPLIWMQRATEAPRIHDITTDTTHPPAFDAVLPLRRDAPNPIEYGGADIARQQQAFYPEVKPAMFSLPPRQLFESALAVAKEMGWRIVAADPEAGRIEATDTTFWFGFKDDVVIRITPHNGGSRVDVRSLSRVGLSDVGTNAERIVGYLDTLMLRVEQVGPAGLMTR